MSVIQNCAVFGLFVILIVNSLPAHSAHKDSIVYIDGRNLVTEVLSKGVFDMMADHPEWGISSFRARSAGAEEEARIPAKLPKQHKQKLASEVMYPKSSAGVLLVGRTVEGGRRAGLQTSVMATAVVLSEDGLCITNHHVVEPLLGVRRPSPNTPSPADTTTFTPAVDSVAFVATKDGRVYPILEVLTYSEMADLAIIRVDTRGDKLTPVPLGSSLVPGSRVRTITHPSGHYYYYTEGVVARNSESRSRGVISRRMEITAEYAVGSSGGPIFDEAGNLVGLVSSTSSIESGNRKHQMAVKNTIPVELIRRLFL